MARSSTTYPTKWRNSKTTVIRIPEHLADSITEIAKRLDAAEGYTIREDNETLVLEFLKTTPSHYDLARPVNVASVPQRSPFRYPGGKTWLISHIRAWLRSQGKKPIRLVEPFAGGGIVGLTAAFEGLARHVIMAELDPSVAAVWRVVLNGQAEWLATKIEKFELSLGNVRSVLDAAPSTLRERAFQTIVRNRVQRGGILAPGAGLVKTGESGRGINSRWYPATLARRIREINQRKDRITFLEEDAFSLIAEHARDGECAFYIDPPYTVAARRLYATWKVDHAKLFRTMQSCKGDFLMSYDNTQEIAKLAEDHGFQSRAIAMKNTHHAKMTELLIGRDLSWID